MKFKQIIIVTILALCSSVVYGQKNMIFRFSNDYKYGRDLQGDNKPMTFGSEFSAELPLYGDWKQDYTFHFPSVGFAVTPFWTKLDSLCSRTTPRGEHEAPHCAWTVATYPYLNWSFVHTPNFAANLKFGSGFAFYPSGMTNKEEWRSEKPYTVLTRYNASLITAGLDFHFRLGRKFGQKTYNWEISAGAEAFVINTFGLNRSAEEKHFITVHLGAKYTPNIWALPIWQSAQKVDKILALEFDITGGVNQLEAADRGRFYPNGSITAGAYLPLSNAYRLGLGAEGFYNHIYDGTQREYNRRYNFIQEDKIKNKIRAGIFLANDLTIYKFVASLGIGFYVFNPIKVPAKDDLGNKNKNYKIENLMYEKLTVKYHVTKKFYVVGRLKTHLLEFENVESGVGLAIPDFGKRLYNPFKRLKNPFKRKEDYTEEKVQGQRNRYYLPRED